jgi:hypothetical protein
VGQGAVAISGRTIKIPTSSTARSVVSSQRGVELSSLSIVRYGRHWGQRLQKRLTNAVQTRPLATSANSFEL